MYIYTLSRNDVPFYVGITWDAKSRHRSHRSIQDEPFDFEILEETNDRSMEKYWIQQFETWGFDLENITDTLGGEVYKRELTSRVSRAKYEKPEARKHQSDRMKLWWNKRKGHGG